MKQFIKRSVGYFWHALAVTIIAVAIVVQLGRELSPLVDDLRPTVTDYLSRHFGAEIDMQALHLSWEKLKLELIVEQLVIYRKSGDQTSSNQTLNNQTSDNTVLQVDHANLRLDILSSLLQGQLIWQQVVLHDVYIHAEQNSAGVWNLAGFSRTASNRSFDPSDLFVLSEQVALRNATIVLNFRTGQKTRLSIPTIIIENDESFHRLQASANVDGDNRIVDFVVEGVGDPRNRETFSAKGFLALKDFPVSDLLTALPRKSAGDDDNTWHQSGHIDLQLWINFLKPNAFAVQGDFTVNNLQSIHGGKPIIIAESISSLFSGAIDLESESSLSFSRVNIDNNDQMTLPNVNFRSSADKIALHVDQMNIGPWFAWLTEKPFLTDAVRQVLLRLSPTGTLKNSALTSKIGDWQTFQLRSNIVDTDVAAWKNIPSFTGINGYLETTMKQGFIDLESERFQLFPTSLYDSELQLAKTKGQIGWHLRPEQNSIIVNSGSIHSDSQYGQAHGVFYLDLPWTPRTRPSHFILQLGLQNAKVKDYQVFLPNKLPESLQTWLAASVTRANRNSGKIPTAGFIYHGPFTQQHPGERSLQFFADISQGALTYSPQWPTVTDIQGQLIIDNDRVTANVKRGKIYDIAISDTTVYWPGPHRNSGDDNRQPIPQLHIKGSARGPAESGLRLLQDSWLRTKVGSVFDHWTADGNLEANLTLSLPLLNTEVAPAYDVTVKLHDSNIDLQKQNVPLHRTNGELTISSDNGFLSRGIDTTLWGHPLAITINNSLQQGVDYLSIEGRGSTDIKAVASWLNRPELLFASGETNVVVQMQIPLQAAEKAKQANNDNEDNQTYTEGIEGGATEYREREAASDFRLTLQSDLTGIEIDLPAPFAKKANDPLPLNILLTADDSDITYDIHFGELGRLLLAQESEQLIGGVFRYQTDDIALEKGKFLVTGYTETLAIDPWRAVIDRYYQHQQTLAKIQQTSAVKTATQTVDTELAGFNSMSDTGIAHASTKTPEVSTPITTELDWSFGSVYFNKTLLSNVYVTANQKVNFWEIDISSPNVTGTLSLFDDKRPTKVHFQKLQWPPAKAANQEMPDSQAGVSIDQWTNTDFSAIPPLNFSVDNLILLGKTLGQWEFKLRPVNNGKGIELNDLYGKIETLTFTGNNNARGGYFRWDQGVDGSKRSQSQLIGVLTGGDIKPLLDKWQLSPLESKKSHLAIELVWPGSPEAFAVDELLGDITITMKEGRFIRATNGETTDLLRLFGLFNFDTWARRLRLDFSDLYKRGLSFDSLEGRIEFEEGIIYLTKPLVVKGPSSDLKMAGKIHYEKQQIDAGLVAKLPVSGNLILGIALTAGLPAAAGAYAVSKLFESQVDKVASLSYTIKGDWDNPDIRFDQLFDEKAAKKAGQTAEKEKVDKSLAK